MSTLTPFFNPINDSYALKITRLSVVEAALNNLAIKI